MYTHLLLISTVQFSRAYCSFFYYNIFIVSEQVFLRFFMNLSRHARMCNSSHHLQDATEKLFLHTIYSVLILTDVLYFVLIYTKKGLFQWRPYRGEGILATVVKFLQSKKATTIFDNCLYLNFCKRKRQSISRLKSTGFPMSYSIFPSDNGIIYITPCKMQFRLVNTAFSAC